MENILNWIHKLDEVADKPRAFERVATDHQRLGLLDAFGLVACDRFSAHYQLKVISGARVALVGQIIAEGAQACVVTLEPVPFRLDEYIDVTFAPSLTLAPQDPEIEHEASSLQDVEPYSGCELNVGDVLFDHFGSALNPYPRAPGAALEGSFETNPDQDQTTHPFAELKKLKDKG